MHGSEGPGPGTIPYLPKTALGEDIPPGELGIIIRTTRNHFAVPIDVSVPPEHRTWGGQLLHMRDQSPVLQGVGRIFLIFRQRRHKFLGMLHRAAGEQFDAVVICPQLPTELGDLIHLMLVVFHADEFYFDGRQGA